MNIEDINLFTNYNQLRKDNNKNNKIRENIIYNIIKNTIPNEWYIENKKWLELKIKLFDIINLLSNNIKYDNIDIILKGGRNFNYDFELLYLSNFIIINKIYIEFKYNTYRIDKYPQFLSISANKFIKGITYAEYFYDNYIMELSKLIDINIPCKIEYLKSIYNNDYTKLLFFTKLKEKEHLIIKEKKTIVSLSIKKYLNDIVNLDIDSINKTFSEKQLNKNYILYYKDNFYYDKILNEELIITGIEKIKNNNTLILNTITNTKILMLLRWKNHIGILYPAWQISLIRYN
jgi:hypothetical protein